jgi:LEA14-like dessication related protein
MRSTWKYAGAFLLLLSAGCATLDQLMQPPKVSVQSVRPVSISPSRVGFVAKLAVANQLPLSVPLEKLAFAVQINGHAFVDGSLDNLPALGAGAETVVEVPFQVGFKELLAVIGEVTSRSKMRVDFQGRLTPGGDLSFLTVPFSLSVDLPVPRLPRVTFAGFSLLKNQAVGVSFKFENINAFPLTLQTLQAKVKLDQTSYSLVSLVEAVPLPAEQSALVQLKLGDSLLKTAAVAARVLSGQKISSSFEGEASADSEYGQLQIPLSLKGIF